MLSYKIVRLFLTWLTFMCTGPRVTISINPLQNYHLANGKKPPLKWTDVHASKPGAKGLCCAPEMTLSLRSALASRVVCNPLSHLDRWSVAHTASSPLKRFAVALDKLVCRGPSVLTNSQELSEPNLLKNIVRKRHLAATACILSYIPVGVANAVVSADSVAALSANLDLNLIAQLLGYVVGAGSLLLYTPIIWRILQRDNAEDLALSTWWLKLSAYTATDIYCFSKGFPLSAFVETAVISVEAAVLLVLVAWKQNRLFDREFSAILAVYLTVSSWAALAPAPPEVLAFGQASSAILSSSAIVPQLVLNFQRSDPGGYSPLTAGLASAGCLIRLFTTQQLANGDPILLAGYGLALVLNSGLLAQILYYGLVIQNKTLLSLLGFDFASAPSRESNKPG